MAVSFTESVKPHLTVLRSDYNDAERFLLGMSGTYGHRDSLRSLDDNVLIAQCRGTFG